MRPNEVDAVQFTGGNASFREMRQVFGIDFQARFDELLGIIEFRSGKQVQQCFLTDWILRTEQGAFFVVKDFRLKENYEPI